jgi:hypothetical protein
MKRAPVGGIGAVMIVVVDTAHFHAERDERRRLIVLRRSDSRFAIADMGEVFAPVEAALADVDGWQLLLDMRRAPARPEEGFEDAMQTHMGPLMARFARRAVLVRSAVGVLQVSRVSKKLGGSDDDIAVFRDDEAGALAWLTG